MFGREIMDDVSDQHYPKKVPTSKSKLRTLQGGEANTNTNQFLTIELERLFYRVFDVYDWSYFLVIISSSFSIAGSTFPSTRPLWVEVKYLSMAISRVTASFRQYMRRYRFKSFPVGSETPSVRRFFSADALASFQASSFHLRNYLVDWFCLVVEKIMGWVYFLASSSLSKMQFLARRAKWWSVRLGIGELEDVLCLNWWNCFKV